MKKEDVSTLLEARIAEAVQKYGVSESWSYFSLLRSAVDSYYSDVEVVSEAMRGVIRAMHTAISLAEMKCEKDEELGIDYEKPQKLTGEFYTWGWLNEELPITTDVTTGLPAELQPSLDEIILEVTGARAVEADKLDEYSESVWGSNSKNDLICILEDRGEVVAYAKKQEVGTEIYVDYEVLEIIEENGLDVYIPTYLR